MIIRTSSYLRLRFKPGGRDRPEVDCWGLYRLIVGEHRGIWLADFEGVETPIAIARTLAEAERSPSWTQVTPGEERALDLVLMRGIIGSGRGAVGAPMHVGCVLEPGRMIDIEETTGVMTRAYRDTRYFAAMPTVRHRVLGIYRAEALA